MKNNKVSYEYLWDTNSGQDGTIYGDYLFRFDHKGICNVYSISEKSKISSFVLDRCDVLMPHSNAVCFGNEFWEAEDEFPLLYSNIYNNYAKEDDRLEGVLCVYRLTRDGNAFATKLVQVIRIGFVENLEYWKSLEEKGDIRPYGNFVVDKENSLLCAFVMRDREQVTRYFTFTLPKVSEGIYCEKYGVNVVTLELSDIRTQFDCEYSLFIQGACCRDGKIYSVEGFSSETRPAKLQVIDLIKEEQISSVDLRGIGLEIEPEFIEFAGDLLYYGDGTGRMFCLTFV